MTNLGKKPFLPWNKSVRIVKRKS